MLPFEKRPADICMGQQAMDLCQLLLFQDVPRDGRQFVIDCTNNMLQIQLCPSHGRTSQD